MGAKVDKGPFWIAGALLALGIAGHACAETSAATPPTDKNLDTGLLLAEYRQQQARKEQLTLDKARLTGQLEAQAKELAGLEQRLALIPSEAQVLALLRQMVETLGAFVQADLPFHRKERQERVAELGALIERADLGASEKLSRLMKAYQDELEYGRTIEAYDGELEAPGGAEGKRLVTYLRYGRVSLVYQTFDGGETALWDKREGNWKPLNGRLAAEVKQGIRIALKRLPPDMLILPVQGAIQ